MLIGWKVSTLVPHIASVRYRAVMPMLALEATYARSRLFSSGFDSNLDGLDALVIVKSFTPDDLRLAQLAADRGLPVVYDLCDNIFVPGYGGGGVAGSPAQVFLSIAKCVGCVVTTTEPLAGVIKEQVGTVPVVVIPDGIETPDLGGRISRVLADAAAAEQAQRMPVMRLRVRHALRRVHTEGVRAIPPLMDSLARRVGTAVRQRLNRTIARNGSGTLPAADRTRPTAKRIVWFGNHGAEHAAFGMLDILLFRDALEAMAAEQEVELVVISNNLQKYRSHIEPLNIPSRYVEWSVQQLEQELRAAALVIVPNTLDSFSACKSANRTVLALAHGLPVVATMTPALQPLAEFIHAGPPLDAFREILADLPSARGTSLEGFRRAEVLFGMKSIQAHWLRLLDELPEAQGAPSNAAQPYLAVVLHLVQDLDLALPVLQVARIAGIACEAWCSSVLISKSPRVLATLRSQDISFRVLPAEENLKSYRFPEATRVLLTIAESNLGPHRVPRLLSEAADRQGLFVATMQHGFENVGLTYDEPLQSVDKVDFSAKRIYIWGPLQTLHSRVSDIVRARCVPVGCPKEPWAAAEGVARLLPQAREIVGLFENLHWHRYTEHYRAAFMANVEALIRSFPEVLFVLKPHHAGLWLTRHYEHEKPASDNLLIADPQSPEWEHHTAGALMTHMSAVITTPSTVALDAARMGLPVAVVADDLRLENYSPLSLLADQADWIDFVRRALDRGSRGNLEELSSRFVDRVITPGNAAQRIVDDLLGMGERVQ